jgi:serine/threonine kinase 32
MKGEPTYPVTNPPVSMPCLHAISSLLEKDKRQRIGAIGFESFSDNPFFRPIDFLALEAKEIPPVFLPSSEKTNFDATYDLEELLLEEAPLEARARRQKPREQLKDDATDAEIRAEELHKMIETLFEPFDYTLVPIEDRLSDVGGGRRTGTNTPNSTSSPSDFQKRERETTPRPSGAESSLPIRTSTPPMPSRSRASTQSPHGSPPLPTMNFDLQFNSTGKIPRSIPDDYHNYLKDANTRIEDAEPPLVPNPAKRRKGGVTRNTSAGGGMQNVLHATGSWSELGEPPTTGNVSSGDEREKRPSGMLGFLARKKGRDRSPKAKERGVLGKEGARVIISNS